MLRQIVSGSVYLIIIAVMGIFIIATALLVYGAVDVFFILQNLLAASSTEKIGKQLVLDSIELIDIFLLATVMYVIAIGLYELFIDDTLPVPDWLEIHNLDDLKSKLVAVVIVVLGVVFLGQVISWDGQRDLLGFGIGVAAVGAMLTYFLAQKGTKADKSTASTIGKDDQG